jgi:hypothetical protein
MTCGTQRQLPSRTLCDPIKKETAFTALNRRQYLFNYFDIRVGAIYHKIYKISCAQIYLLIQFKQRMLTSLRSNNYRIHSVKGKKGVNALSTFFLLPAYNYK